MVERYNHHTRKRHDFLGIIDIIAIHPRKKGCLGVQTTNYGNVGNHLRKLRENPNTKLWLDCGNRLLVYGWRKVKNRWVPRVVECLKESPTSDSG